MGWPWILKHSCCLFFVDLRPPAHVGAQPVMAALPPNEAEEWLKKAVRTDAQGGVAATAQATAVAPPPPPTPKPPSPQRSPGGRLSNQPSPGSPKSKTGGASPKGPSSPKWSPRKRRASMHVDHGRLHFTSENMNQVRCLRACEGVRV